MLQTKNYHEMHSDLRLMRELLFPTAMCFAMRLVVLLDQRLYVFICVCVYSSGCEYNFRACVCVRVFR